MLFFLKVVVAGVKLKILKANHNRQFKPATIRIVVVAGHCCPVKVPDDYYKV